MRSGIILNQIEASTTIHLEDSAQQEAERSIPNAFVTAHIYINAGLREVELHTPGPISD